MTIELKPEQAQVIDRAIAAGLIERPDEVVTLGVDSLRGRLAWNATPAAITRSQLAGERIRELRKGVTLDGGTTIKELIEEGRE